MQKKQYLILGIVLVILILAGIIFLLTSKKIKAINYEAYEHKFENKETFILYVGSKDCTHCQSFRPTLEKIVRDYRLDVFYLDVSTLNEEEYAKMENKTHLKGTPTVVFVEEGRVKTSPKIVGDLSYHDAVEIFKESGYIK